MYEMYPENWSHDLPARVAVAESHPRRRVRREHRILPIVAVPVGAEDGVVRPDGTAR